MAYFAATPRRVEFSDTDMAGIAHFSAFFRWMEAAEHELLRSLGLSVYSKLAGGDVVSFPRVAAECDYRSPARCEDLLEIEVDVDRIGTKSVAYRFRFLLAGVEIAEGKMTSVCCRIVADTPPQSIPLPDEIVDGLRPFVAA
ncbi:MAG: thioesterase family protein [Planctomycetota bacterium]